VVVVPVVVPAAGAIAPSVVAPAAGAAVASAAGAVEVAVESVLVLMVEVDSVVAGVVVVDSVVDLDSHEARPTARNRADTFSRLFILG
jgi:hypothetical protein